MRTKKIKNIETTIDPMINAVILTPFCYSGCTTQALSVNKKAHVLTISFILLLDKYRPNSNNSPLRVPLEFPIYLELPSLNLIFNKAKRQPSIISETMAQLTDIADKIKAITGAKNELSYNAVNIPRTAI
jgi:hypothetical protein